jgi:D-serine deaminase-like pyridoxal phosphate-dependent protein
MRIDHPSYRPIGAEADEDLIGRMLTDLDTPAPLLDLDRFESNAAYICGFLGAHGLGWRPHSKGHKSPFLARRQLELGAIGITCAKLSEAEVMIAGGIPEVLVANHLGTARKWARAAAVQRVGRVIVCVDDFEHVRLASIAASAAGVTIPLLLEVDIGMHRVGVTSPDAALDLAAQIHALPGLQLLGVMGYEGHLLRAWPAEEKRQRCAEALAILTGTADALRADGHTVEIVSSGGTGSFEHTADVAGLTESQAGGGCLMDRFYAEDCHVTLAHALTLLATTVSVQTEGRAIVDAGFKALGSPSGFAAPWILERPGVEVLALSAEHGILTVAANPLAVGDQVRIIPAYSDAMLFLHDRLIGHRNGRVTDVIAMPGRGRLT